jgi:glycine cleavage system H protein
MYPADLRYTREHEWVAIDGDRARVGITHYAQDQLGEVVWVQLPPVGRTLRQGEVFGAVESVKAASDLFCPMSGEVVEVNDALATHPETINQSPHTTWLIVLKVGDPGEASVLLTAAQYGELVSAAP